MMQSGRQDAAEAKLQDIAPFLLDKISSISSPSAKFLLRFSSVPAISLLSLLLLMNFFDNTSDGEK
jgi:hypothetical protein